MSNFIYPRFSNIFFTPFPSKSSSCNEEEVSTKKTHTGMNCCHCSERNEYAETNLKDGRYCCYSCRDSNKWIYDDLVINVKR